MMKETDFARVKFHPLKCALLSPWDLLFLYLVEKQHHWIQFPRYKIKFASLPGTVSTENSGKANLHVICAACAGVFQHSKLISGSWKGFVPTAEVHILHSTFADLEASVRDGCHFCALITSMVQRSDEQVEMPCISLEICTAFGNWGIDYTINARHGQPSTVQQILEKRHRPCFKLKRTKVQHAHSISYCSTDSRHHMALARMWLEECIKTHPECCPNDKMFVPTRLLDLTGFNDQIIQLRICGVKDKGVSYCTLSHCWGGVDDILTLRSGNLEMMKHSIPINTLPKPFRDAISITKAIGQNFLWIDSLCIIQDLEEDWAADATRMGKMYENSACTIAAGAAQNSHEGCFSTRNPLTFASCQVASFGKGTAGLLVTPDPLSQDRSLQIKNRPRLEPRAWVFQEEELSSRILYFGRESIRWQCRPGCATESDPAGRGLRNLRGGRKLVPLFGFGNRRWDAIWDGQRIDSYTFGKSYPAVGRGDLEHKFHLQWFTSLSNYTKRDLTIPTDRLIALAGIAERIERHTGRKYTAGIWEESLLDDLLWRINGTPQSRPPSYIAPTWSWASTIGPVASPFWKISGIELPHANSNDNITYMAEIKSITTLPFSTEVGKFGRIKDGQLEVVGLLKRVNLNHVGMGNKGYDQLSKTFRDGNTIRFFPDTFDDPRFQHLFFLPFKRVVVTRGSKRNIFDCEFDLRIEGIVVVPRSNVYERIGFFGMYAEDINDAIFHWFEGCENRVITIK